MKITTATLGYPHLGKKREMKKALEAFCRQKISQKTLRKIQLQVEENNWKTQLIKGINKIGIGDTTLYDLVLDWTIRLGLIPQRFQHLEGLERYLVMARGEKGIPALEMTKWFDTNYHYLVPEINSDILPADFSDFLATIHRGQTILGKRAIPIILGPITLLRLSRLDLPMSDVLSQLLERYLLLLTELKNLGLEEVQMHEPALVLGDAANFKEACESTYHSLAKVGLPLHLVTYFDDLGETYSWVIKLPVVAISLDFTRGRNLDLLKQYGFPEDKRLGVGIVDAQNIWQIRPDKALTLLSEIQALVSHISIQPSASLQFVPYDSKRENKLPKPLRNVLSFAEQKLEEVRFLASTIEGKYTQPEQDLIEENWKYFQQFSPRHPSVQQTLKTLKFDDFQRSLRRSR